MASRAEWLEKQPPVMYKLCERSLISSLFFRDSVQTACKVLLFLVIPKSQYRCNFETNDGVPSSCAMKFTIDVDGYTRAI
eukprot:1319026-Amorphochlora_amoeboformis.AAC.1